MSIKKLHRRNFIQNTGIMTTGLMALQYPVLKAVAQRYLTDKWLNNGEELASLYKRG